MKAPQKQPQWDKPSPRRRTAVLAENLTITEQLPTAEPTNTQAPTIIVKSKSDVICVIFSPNGRVKARTPLQALAAAFQHSDLDNMLMWNALENLAATHPHRKIVQNFVTRTARRLPTMLADQPGKRWRNRTLRAWTRLVTAHLPTISIPPTILSRVL